MIGKVTYDVVMANKEVLDNAIDYSRDFGYVRRVPFLFLAPRASRD